MTKKKQTKSERIDEKMATGLSRLDAEIEVAREDAAEKISRLEKRQAREQARIEARAVDVLKRDHVEVWERALTVARGEIEADRVKRSRARRKAGAATADHDGHDGYDGYGGDGS
ncbi:hypothetical protein [Corynebacterium xerosis]|uniref:hypothetical protein n=1 Tax=Corynebacterium xerosis TaxID=1725 RepID=UPI0013CE8BC7|nr:hypothetical protein [Corynebacterium xerosis]